MNQSLDGDIAAPGDDLGWSMPSADRRPSGVPRAAYVSERAARRATVAPRWEAGSSWNSTTKG